MPHNVTRRMDHYEGFREALVEYQRISHIGSEYERKQVYQIRCGHCLTILTNRGMNAVLLSDRSIQLFSTDLLPDTLGFVHGDYSAASCSCRVRDTACLTCGNIVGYHVNVPCKVCLSQPNNGHYWMFRSADIKPFAIKFERIGNNDLPLLWGFVYGAGEFNGKSFRSGNLEGAHRSCQLSVKLPWHLRLIVHSAKFLEQVEAVASDEDARDLYAEVCR